MNVAPRSAHNGTACFPRSDKGVTQNDYLQRCDEWPLTQRPSAPMPALRLTDGTLSAFLIAYLPHSFQPIYCER